MFAGHVADVSNCVISQISQASQRLAAPGFCKRDLRIAINAENVIGGFGADVVG